VKEPLQHIYLGQLDKSAIAEQNFNMEHHMQLLYTKTLHNILLYGVEYVGSNVTSTATQSQLLSTRQITLLQLLFSSNLQHPEVHYLISVTYT